MLKLSIYYITDEYRPHVYLGTPKGIWMLWFNLRSVKKELNIKKIVITNLDGKEVNLEKDSSEYLVFSMSTKMD